MFKNLAGRPNLARTAPDFEFEGLFKLLFFKF